MNSSYENLRRSIAVTRLGSVVSFINAKILSAAISPMRRLASVVAEPIWGVVRTLGSAIYDLNIQGIDPKARSMDIISDTIRSCPI